MLRNKIRGYTYLWLNLERRALDRRTEISRTLNFYACFFGRERRGLSLFGWCGGGGVGGVSSVCLFAVEC